MVVPSDVLSPMHGIMYKSYCILCCMSTPHFVCYPTVLPDSDVTEKLLKSMSEKVEQGNTNGQQWMPFPPPFNSRAPIEPHPFNYEQQHRAREPAPIDFDNDLARQQAQPSFVPNFFPRLSIPFTDFAEYQRFNGFQRNAFFNPFGQQTFINPAWNTFQLNPAPMPAMDGFHFPPNGQNPPPLQNIVKQKDNLPLPLHPPRVPTAEDKPPVLSAEYNIKHCLDHKFEASPQQLLHVKDEPLDLEHRKSGSYPPPLPIEKPFESISRPFYNSTPPEIHINRDFKQEVVTTPPGTLHDCQVCLSTHANGLHFGARTCAACAAFFRRTVSDQKRYVCKRNQRCTNASRDGTGYRKICRACRMQRCMDIGMLPENVQHKRNRRESGSTPPPQKNSFDTFFTGFYPTFNPPPAPILPIPPAQMPVEPARQIAN